MTQTNMAAPTMGGIGIKSPRKSDDTSLFRRYIDNRGKVQFSEVSVPQTMPENVNCNAARPGKSPDYVETESNHSEADCDDDFDAVEGADSDQISDTESPKDEHEQEVIDFRGRLKLVWECLSDKLPSNVSQKKKSFKPKSLITARQDDREEPNWLPLADITRQWFTYWTNCGINSLQSGKLQYQSSKKKCDEAGKFPTKFPKWPNSYKTASVDYSLEKPDLSDDTRRELKGNSIPPISFDSKVATALENHTRLGISAASTNEWFLGTIKTIMEKLQEHLMGDDPQIQHVSDGLKTCLDLLDTVGKASEVELGTLTYITYVLNLARRDSILRIIPNISTELKEKLRHAPIIWETPDQPHQEDYKPAFLFRGLSSQLAEDRKRDAELAIQNLILAKNKPHKFTQPINTEKRKFQGSYPSQKKDKPKTFPKTNYKETNQERPLQAQNQNRLDSGHWPAIQQRSWTTAWFFSWTPG